MFSRVFPAHLNSDVHREDDEADHLDALGEAAGRLPGWRAMPGVRGDGEGGRALHEGQQQHRRYGQTQTPEGGERGGLFKLTETPRALSERPLNIVSVALEHKHGSSARPAPSGRAAGRT